MDVKREAIRAVEVTCPACGGRGKARLTKPTDKVCCQFCERTFRPSEASREVSVSKSDLQKTLVEAAKVARTEPAPQVESVREFETVGEALQMLRERLEDVPRWMLMSTALLVVLLVSYGLWSTAPLLFTSVPDDLAGRAKFVAEGVARNLPARINAISAYGTGSQAQAWADLKRPKDWITQITRETPIAFQVQVVFENRERGKAATVVSVWPGVEPTPTAEAGKAEGGGKELPKKQDLKKPHAKKPDLKSPAGAPAAQVTTVLKPATAAAQSPAFYEVHWVMHWVLGPHGWVLDGKETLEAGKLR